MAQKRKTRKPLTLNELRCSMSTALRELENVYMDTDTETELRVRAINSLATLANSYAKISEVSDLEARITELESNQLRKVVA